VKPLLWILVLYLVGIFVRDSYGTHWEIKNKSGAALNDVSLGFVGWKYHKKSPCMNLLPGKCSVSFLSRA
jgi:hypothetical protein